MGSCCALRSMTELRGQHAENCMLSFFCVSVKKIKMTGIQRSSVKKCRTLSVG